MDDSDYTKAEKVTMLTLFVPFIAVETVTWFVGGDGWFGWLGVLLIAPQIVIALRARRRFCLAKGTADPRPA